MIKLLGMTLGILGLIATLASLWFTYNVYATPLRRIKKYLKDVEGWNFTSSRFNETFEYWQYTKHPEFTIELKDDQKWDREEPWVKRVRRPDPSLFMYEVALKINGLVVRSENFLAMDGWRYLVPIPRVDRVNAEDEQDYVYYYDAVQYSIAGVVGKYHLDKNIEDFCEHSRIHLRLK